MIRKISPDETKYNAYKTSTLLFALLLGSFARMFN